MGGVAGPFATSHHQASICLCCLCNCAPPDGDCSVQHQSWAGWPGVPACQRSPRATLGCLPSRRLHPAPAWRRMDGTPPVHGSSSSSSMALHPLTPRLAPPARAHPAVLGWGLGATSTSPPAAQAGALLGVKQHVQPCVKVGCSRRGPASAGQVCMPPADPRLRPAGAGAGRACSMTRLVRLTQLSTCLPARSIVTRVGTWKGRRGRGLPALSIDVLLGVMHSRTCPCAQEEDEEEQEQGRIAGQAAAAARARNGACHSSACACAYTAQDATRARIGAGAGSG